MICKDAILDLDKLDSFPPTAFEPLSTVARALDLYSRGCGFKSLHQHLLLLVKIFVLIVLCKKPLMRLIYYTGRRLNCIYAVQLYHDTTVRNLNPNSILAVIAQLNCQPAVIMSQVCMQASSRCTTPLCRGRKNNRNMNKDNYYGETLTQDPRLEIECSTTFSKTSWTPLLFIFLTLFPFSLPAQCWKPAEKISHLRHKF